MKSIFAPIAPGILLSRALSFKHCVEARGAVNNAEI